VQKHVLSIARLAPSNWAKVLQRSATCCILPERIPAVPPRDSNGGRAATCCTMFATCMRVCVATCMRVCVATCMRVCVATCMRVCVATCMRVCSRTSHRTFERQSTAAREWWSLGGTGTAPAAYLVEVYDGRVRLVARCVCRRLNRRLRHLLRLRRLDRILDQRKAKPAIRIGTCRRRRRRRLRGVAPQLPQRRRRADWSICSAAKVTGTQARRDTGATHADTHALRDTETHAHGRYPRRTCRLLAPGQSRRAEPHGMRCRRDAHRVLRA
jgi:hypothetical protein